MLASPGDTLSVPILVSDVTQDSVLSAKASVRYDAPWLTNPSLSTNGTLINDWGFKESNLVDGKLQMAAASATPLLGAGVLVFMHFVVDPSAEPGSYTDLILEDVLFNEGVPSAAIQWGSVSVTTLRPTADFGMVSTGVTARFTDLSTGPNAIVAWSWSFGDGTTSALQHPVHAYVNKQAYTVHLTVTDEAGISDTVTRGILLNDRPVIISIHPDTTRVEIDEGESVVFEVEALDSEGDPLTYRWFVNGADQSVKGNSLPYVSNYVPPRAAGVDTIGVSVSDAGGTADTTWVLTIRDVPQNPVVAGIPDQTILEGQRFAPFDLDGYVTDVDSDPNTLTWQDSGAVDITVIVEENTHIVTLTAPTGWTGSEQITFVATDPEGLKGAGVMTASVKADERAPQILTGPVAVGVTDSEAVIFWTTDEPSDGHVAYGLELGYALADSSEEQATDHWIALTGLVADTTYYYRVWSVDETGNPSPFKGGAFRTQAEPDTTGPRILTGPAAVSVTDHEATVIWSTDEVSDTHIAYSAGDMSYALSHSLPKRVSDHLIALAGLVADTTYYYRVWSVDPSGNPSAFKTGVFLTKAEPDTLAPRIVNGPGVVGITYDRATVLWTTDEPAIGYVRYGPTAKYGLRDSTAVTASVHGITLTSLLPGTTYYYQVWATDPSGNVSQVRGGSFLTEAAPDTVVPRLLTGPAAVGVTHDGATIEWTTDEISDSFVEFGTGVSLASATVGSAKDETEHRVRLTGLSPNTTYIYRVRSTDPSDNTMVTRQFAFDTKAAPDTRAPVVLSGPIATGITYNSARIEWITDEISDSRVEYGLDGMLDQSREDANDMRKHLLLLTHLVSDRTYSFRAISTDPSDNAHSSGVFTFRTKAAPDITPPIVLTGPIAAGITYNSARIEWITDEISDSRVEYGLDGALDRSKVDANDMRNHLLSLTNLTSDRTYRYRVISTDPSDNARTSSVFTFKTKGVPDTNSPVITEGPIVSAKTYNSATIEWKTDELSDGFIGFGLGDVVSSWEGEAQDEIAHRVTLTHLLSDTTYTYQVRSVDPSDNAPTTSKRFRFKTWAAPDTQAPRIVWAPIIASRAARSATVKWETDEPSDSEVAYGADATYGEEVVFSEDVKRHSVNLTNLEPATTYHYRVGSTDPTGNGPTFNGGDLTFTTKTEPDILSPKILTGPFVPSITHNSALVSWRTDEPSDSKVAYGPDTTYGEEVLSPEDVREHASRLTNLNASTAYHYRVISVDPSGNPPTSSPDRTFTTMAAPDTLDPRILTGPTVLSKTYDSATIVWTTNELSDTFLEYGPSTAYGLEQGDASGVNRHVVVLTKLTPGTLYHYRAGSTDPSGNGPALSKNVSFTTKAAPDTNPPVILTGPLADLRDVTAVISWETDEQSTTGILYGTPETFGIPGQQEEEVLPEYVREHVITITGLVPGVQYLYRVFSKDIQGNTAWSAVPRVSSKRAGIAKILQPPGWGGEFTTNSYADTQVPVILSGPGVPFKNDSQATIVWNTDERSDSVVEYGIDSGGAGKIVAGETYPYRTEWSEDLLAHEVTLTNLDAGALIRYRVGSTDPSGNGATWSSAGVVQTDQLADTEAPEIVSGPEVLLRTDQSVVIGWDTDEPGDSVVEVGLDTTYGNERNAIEDVTGHRITLTNLTASTTYHYRVGSTDPSGNGPTWSADGVFDTQAEPDGTPPLIVSGPTVVAKTDVSVLIKWATNELADSFVKYGQDVSYGFSAGSVEDVTNHRLELTNLTANTVYHYHVGSIDRSGNGPTQSADSTFTTDAWPDTTAPAAPTGFSAERKDGRVILGWTANTEADVLGYNVYRRKETEEPGAFGAIVTIVSGVKYVDGGVIEETTYGYRITAVDRTGNESDPSSVAVDVADETGNPLPEVYGLAPNFPNPFNSVTWVRYQLPVDGAVTLSIYNILGQRIRVLVDAPRTAGFYQVMWDGRDAGGHAVSSGMYLIRIQTGPFTKVRKMALLK
ncbi:MAG: fibronectin type III domain-containing protein [Candidatus Latescibacterota bacterium]